MILRNVILENFRSYKNKTVIEIDDLTAFIGRNDFGKSTVLEALEIFFNNDLVKIDANDPTKGSGSQEVRIGCVFEISSDTMILDETAETTLQDEYMLNDDGNLEIHQVFNCSLKTIRPKLYAIANHPTHTHANNLLTLKNTDLKTKYRDLGLDESVVDLRSNPALRQTIWNSIEPQDLALHETSIPLDQQGAKEIWDKLEGYLPTYALFKADRPSTDTDAEVQDPMKLAIKEAIKTVEDQLNAIKQEVERHAMDVASRTLEKLQEMAPELAGELNPRFTSEPRWDGFKLSLTGEDEIPINKRGSGVRRLILLNFFRAEAERKATEENRKQVIYAIEEPEVSQHPTNQEMLVKALLDLSRRENHQVILTTHVPRLAGLLPAESIRYVSRNEGHPIVQSKTEDVYQLVVKELGVLPDPQALSDIVEHLKLLICVEGTRDVAFLKYVCNLFISNDIDLKIPDIENDPRIVVIPLYGNNLKQWVESDYFRGTGVLEFHIFDRDADEKYKNACDTVNKRKDLSYGVLTTKPSVENYFHIDLVNNVFDLNLTVEQVIENNHDVIELVVNGVREKSKQNEIRKVVINGSSHKKWRNNAKYYLHETALKQMTLAQLTEVDPDGEVEGWLKKIAELLDS